MLLILLEVQTIFDVQVATSLFEFLKTKPLKSESIAAIASQELVGCLRIQLLLTTLPQGPGLECKT